MAMSRHVSTLSAVHRGAAFEQRSLQLLQAHFSMALRRVGGRSDGGIDLVGWWWLPFTTDAPGALPDPDGLLRRRLRVLAQCKAEKKKLGPKYVREMEGVWHLRPPTSEPAVALLLSESHFSQATMLHAYRSTVPFLLIHLPGTDDAECTVCPNPTVTRLVTPLAFRWERNSASASESNGCTRARPGMWWQGRKLASWTPDFPNEDMT